MRIRSITFAFTVLAAVWMFALTMNSAGQAAAQNAAAPGGQQQPAAGGGGGGGGGGRGGGGGTPLPVPRWPDGRPVIGSIPGEPSGIWGSGTTSLPQGQLDQVPFQPWARAAYDQRQIDQFEPHTRCKASGVSRQFSTPYGTEFLEIPDLQRIYIFDQGGPNSYRIIYMDGRSHPENFVPTNYGHSIGRWEGDTLVVETVGLNEKFWIDTRGTPHTEQLKFTERFTRVSRNQMQYQATIDDPGAYTAPWTTTVFNMNFNQGTDLFEYICQDANYGDELMIGSQEEVDNTRFYLP